MFFAEKMILLKNNQPPGPAMNILDIITGNWRNNGKKNGGELVGACPWCGGEGNRPAGDPHPDRFHIWPYQGEHGTYWCRGCKRGGDAIRYLIDHDGLTFPEACARIGKNPQDLQSGEKRDRIPAGWQPSTGPTVDKVWAEHALKFVDWCHARLLERPDEIRWLAERGINMEMVVKYHLGWNPAHAWRERPAWGLAAERNPLTGKFKKLWLPRGLVIPMIAETGAVERIRIRQPDGSPRYYVVPGSGREPMCSGPGEAIVVVEAELDAIAIDGHAGDLVAVVAMGNDSAKPTARLMNVLRSALHISVSLDSDQPRYDPETGRMKMAGATSSAWWLEQFPGIAVRVPMVGGKDPGDAVKDGLNLKVWVMAGLPPFFLVKEELAAERSRREKERALKIEALRMAERQKTADVPDIRNLSPVEKMPEAAESPQGQAPGSYAAQDDGCRDDLQASVKTVTLKNGRIFHLTANRDEWQRLTDAGQVVFSEHELARLQQACAAMNQEERLAAAMTVLDIKEIFSPAWIRRGEAIL